MAKNSSALQFVKDINSINISNMVLEIENELAELNCYEHQFSFGSYLDVERMTREVLEEADFNDIDTITRIGNPVFYWCGVLTAEPWCDLKLEEEEILNIILQDFIRVEEKNNEIFIVFSNNSKSKLYRFFLKYRDGYGLNIPYSINDMLEKLSGWLKEKFESFTSNNYSKYGTWESEITKECPECGEHYNSFDDDEFSECPECKVELEYA